MAKKMAKKKQNKVVAKTNAKTKVKTKVKAKAEAKAKRPVSVKTARKAKSSRPVSVKTKVKTKNKVSKVAVAKSTRPVSTKPLAAFAVLSPLDDRVLISATPMAVKTPGGLFIPDLAQSDSSANEGVVIAVGPGAKQKRGGRRPIDLRIGDRVMFNSYAGQKLDLMGNEYLLLRETEIFGVVE